MIIDNLGCAKETVLTNYPDSFDVSFGWSRYPLRDYLDLVIRWVERLVQRVSITDYKGTTFGKGLVPFRPLLKK